MNRAVLVPLTQFLEGLREASQTELDEAFIVAHVAPENGRCVIFPIVKVDADKNLTYRVIELPYDFVEGDTFEIEVNVS